MPEPAPSPEAPPPGWCEVALGGRQLRLCGPPGDLYFQNAPRAAGRLAPLLALARAVLPPEGVVVDAGANLGLVSLGLAPLVPRGRVHAFEPLGSIFPCLAANLAADPLGNAEPVNLALGAAPGELALFEGPNFAAGSHVVTPSHLNAGELAARPVRATTLDLFAAERGLARLDLLKLDVEGHELAVLAGAAAALERFRPVVYVELNSFVLIAHRDLSPRAFVEALLARFRHVLWLGPKGAVERLGPGPALHRFLHGHLVMRRAIDDLVCCDDDAWLAHYQPPN